MSRVRYWRPGFTLFELLLALALSVVVTGLVGSALVFYSQTLQTRDVEVREAQLARAALRMFAEDLQATVSPPAFDAKALKETLSGGLGGGDSGGSGGGGSDELSGDAASAVGLGGDESTGERDLAGEVQPPKRPGLLGTQFQLQVDVSRLPRTDQYRATTGGAFSLDLQDVPSDIKTVTYYVQQSGTAGIADPWQVGGGNSSTATSSPRALVRRELDRAVTMWALDSGSVQQLWRTGELLATEVAAVEFSYFDGQQWRMQWDSNAIGSLPLAVKISLLIDPRTPAEIEAAGTTLDASAESSQFRRYEQVVRIPMADPITLQLVLQQGAGGASGEL
jgi:type II secretory pathway pseudopilin PulG